MGPAQKSLIGKLERVDDLNAFVRGVNEEMGNAAWKVIYERVCFPYSLVSEMNFSAAK